MLSRHIRLLYPPLVRKVSLTRGGYNSLHESTPKNFGRLRRPKSTFMDLIDSLLSLFRVGQPQAGKFWAFCTRLTRFLAVFQREIDQNTTKKCQNFPACGGRTRNNDKRLSIRFIKVDFGRRRRPKIFGVLSCKLLYPPPC